MATKNWIGNRYGRLMVKAIDPEDSRRCICVCDCGKEKSILKSCLGKGTNSCGCLNSDTAKALLTTHGMTDTRLYGTWCNMKNRCNNPNVQSYKYYGARGIKVCDEWLHDFQAFATWSFENGYDANLSIDRINVDGDYEPSNCRWVDEIFQANNKRTNTRYTFDGKTMTLAEWSREIGISYAVLSRRIHGHKWSVERTLTTPVGDDKWHRYLNKASNQ